MKKKLLATLLSASMVLGVVACGSNTQTTGTDSTASTQTADNAGADTASDAPVEYPPVTFMAIDFNSGASNTGDYAEQVMQQLEEHTGVDVEIQWVQSDVLEEKATLAMQDPKSMPMIMTWNGAVTGTVVTAAKQGAFVDLTEYLKDSTKYPNLSQQNPGVAESLTVDGKQIGIYRARVLGRYGLSYRQDWADALGLAEPKTIDDVYNMLYQFTYGDPDGNGKNDTIGLEMTSYTGPFDIMQTWFGCGNGWAEKDGKLIPVWQQDEYLEALNWFKKCYEEGLMPSDWASRTTDTWSDGCKNGENGVYIDVLDGGRRIWDYFVNNEIPSVTDPSQFASMNLLSNINGKTMATSGYNGYFTLSASTCDTPEKIEAALTLLDKMCDEEMLILTNYGLEGVTYEINENGNVVRLDASDDALKANYNGLNQLVAYIPGTESELTEEKTERQIKEADVKADAEKYAVLNPALPYLINSATYASQGKDLDDKISQARTQYICGEINEDELKAAWQDVLDRGYQQIIDEVNAQVK
ncbi:putative aldouronate transport system substrate-binding protein [Butyrivibrio hungatei DSM 14810]|uniref:Sugar ABC transporter substrate-binding protein n=2 Tax=Butyrivibrio hungatei TaxID=185008 RepID=A0A1D9P3A8_9FIRM|nr:extracellular solute-binding protein [Butyrivibrio hungatei]AOZ96962.1 sugar ABC transporter substrate-binding protein [Butyrivibrio hungatei]SHN49235.1 putative aldouronate transport system substrate-binding protein [Butyrivibrio hungatei DSM 14810]